MSSLERLQVQNESFGHMDEMSKGHRKTGDNIDKRIGEFNRKVGAQVELKSKVRKQRLKSTKHGTSGENSRSPDIDP